MADTRSIADHWATGDVFALVLDAMEASGIDQEAVSIEQLAPVNHFHARGLAATRELADVLPIRPGDRIVDMGAASAGRPDIRGPFRLLRRGDRHHAAFSRCG